MPEWFMPSRRDVPPSLGSVTLTQTELSDPAGAQVVVETRRIGTRTWETTISPGDAPNPDGPDAAVFATVTSSRESLLAHEQAVEFAANALTSTLRRPPP